MLHGLADIRVWGAQAAFLSWLIMGLMVALSEVATREQENLASPAAPVSGASPRGRGSERLYFPMQQERMRVQGNKGRKE
jgi:hypothetical protein